MEEKRAKKILWIHAWRSEAGAAGPWLFNQHAGMAQKVELYAVGRLNNPLKFIKHYFRLRKMAANYALLHAQYGSAVGLITALLPGKKVLSLRGSDWYHPPAHNLAHRLRIFLSHQLSRGILPYYDHIITVSQALASEIRPFIPHKAISVIPTPIDLEKFQPQVKIPRKAPRVLFSAIDLKLKTKRADLALAAFALFQKKYPEAEWLSMTGIAHDKVSEFINSCDMVLLTSTHEGWPNIIKEALACNRPFVATPVSDLNNIAAHSPSCQVCEAEASALAKGLEECWLAPKGENLRRWVEDFELHKTNTRTLAIYEALLK